MAKTQHPERGWCWNCRWYNDSPNYPQTCLLFVKPQPPDHSCYSWTNPGKTWPMPNAHPPDQRRRP